MELAKLTICIPTYNRKDRLINQLHSIFNQDRSNEVIVMVCDNNSDYDIHQALNEVFGSKSNLCIHRNKYNIGGDANIASTFHHCDTKWMWMMSDDDVTTPNSIDKILNDIESVNDNVFGIKYSLEGFTPHKDVTIGNIPDFLDYCVDNKVHAGDIIFISNNVYNIDRLRPYIGNALGRCYCCISQLLPYFDAMSRNDGVLQLSSFPVVTYMPATPGSSWNYLRITLAISTISHLNYNLESKYLKLFREFFLRDFNRKKFLGDCFSAKPKEYGKFVFDTVYFSVFRYETNCKIKNRLYKLLFYLSYYTNVNIFAMI